MKFAAFVSLCVCLARASPIIPGESAYPNEYAEIDPFRLPETVKPRTYTLSLVVNKKFKETETFTGNVIIECTLNNIEKDKLKTIKLHKADEMKIDDSDIYVDGFKIVKSNYNKTTEIMELEVNKLNSETKDITIHFTKFTAKLYKDMYGFYLSTYQEGDKEEVLITTQFQATFARRAFPCFDEPLFKAKFQLTITHPSEYHALFNQKSTKIEPNTETGYTETTFGETVPMSPYIVAFIVSKFKSQTIENYNLWSRPEAVATLGFATGITPGIVKSMDDFTEVKYWEMGMSQLDQVAIPDFAAGAMENWGLLTFRETALLWDKDHSTFKNKQRVATVVAHELAHMWFGDWVTCKWWSDTWLNEGFARYFEYYATHDVKPEWGLPRQFVVEQIHTVFPLDSVPSSLPLSNPKTSTADDVKAMFGSITYSKGGSIVRMMSHMFGQENFRASLAAYMKKMKLGSAVPEDLFKELPKIGGKDMTSAVKTWTTQSGFPVVTVSLKGSEATLSQKRFLYIPNKEDKTVWSIPINWATDVKPDFDNTAPQLWLETAEGTDNQKIDMSNANWIVLNKQQTGFYRVNYQRNLWDRLITALKKKRHDGIDVINRAQIVDDSMNLARAGEINYNLAMEITSYLQNETEYYPWYSAFNAFSYLRKRLSGNTKETLTNYVLETMDNLYYSVTFEETGEEGHIEMLKKTLALRWACELNNKECYTKANKIFDAYKAGKPVPQNLRSIVYCAALRHTNTKDNWEYLWKQFKTVTVAHESDTMITALGCTKDAELMKKYLGYTIDVSSGIRQQDAYSAFTAVLTGNPEGVDIAYQFFKDNYNEIVVRYGSMNALTSVINSLADRLTTKQQLKDFEEFVIKNKEHLKDAAAAAEAAIETAKANIEWGDKYKSDLDAWFAGRLKNASPALIISNSLLVVAIVGGIARRFF